MSKEKVFIVDEDNVPQESQSRDIMIQNDLWCRVASIIVVDKEKDAILCHKRSENKDQRPGLWVAEFGGKSNPDEDSIVTAQRELFEESGIECLPEELIFADYTSRQTENNLLTVITFLGQKQLRYR